MNTKAAHPGPCVVRPPSPQGSCRVPGCWLESSDECGDECTEQGLAASARVVHELEKAEIERQLVL